LYPSTAWQSLPEYGVSLFVVKFMGQRKEELLGVAFNRLMRMDLTTGDHIKTWRYNTMKVILSLFILVYVQSLIKIFSSWPGVERQLGSEAHDGPV
jgi:hypothetical protein